MADLDQAEQDKVEQEQRREFYRRQAIDRARAEGGLAKSMVKRGIQEPMKELGSKKGFKKFEKALGKGVKKIQAPQRGTGFWIIALVLALTKDFLDMSTMETLSGFDWVLDVLMGIGLFFMFGRSVKLARKLIVTALTTAAEAIPILGFGWWWTLSVLYLYWKAQGAGERE